MATANVAVTYAPVTGRGKTDLTSWAGSASFATTPVSTDQIEYPDAVNVSVSGVVTGAAGTYTIRHVIASTGATEAISVTLTGSKTASESVLFGPGSGRSRVTLTSWSGNVTFPTTPLADDQIIYPDALSVTAAGVATGPNGTYTVHHIIGSSGVIESVSHVISGTNTAPSFPAIGEQVVNVNDTANIDITATDPDGGTNLTYSDDATFPNGITRTVGNLAGTYGLEETVLSTFTVQDDSGDTGNDSDTLQILFSVARAGYTITTSTVDYAGLHVDSPFIAAITDSDLEIGDQFDYPSTQGGRTISISSDGVVTVTGTRSIVIDDVYIRDKSASYARVGPLDITIVGTGPALTGALAVVAASETTSGGQVSFTSDESGDYRVIVIAQNAGTPTRAQVFAGLAPDGGAPLFDSTVTAQAATVEETVTITGLPTEGAGYHVYAALEDQYGGITLAGPVVLSTTTTGTRPTWSAIASQNMTFGEYFELDLSAYASGAISYTLAGPPSSSGLTFDNATGLLSGTPNAIDAPGGAGSTSNYIYAVTAYNASGNTAESFSVSVYHEDPPIASGSISDQIWREGITLTFDIAALNVISPVTTWELQVSVGGTFTDASPVLVSYGMAFNTSTGVITGTPSSVMPTNSPYAFRVRGVNADGISAWITFSTIVNDSTAAGFFGPIPTQNVTEGVAVTINASSYFTNAVSYSIAGLPANSNLVIDSVTGIITGTPNTFDLAASPFTATITATNPNGNAIGTISFAVTSLLPVLTLALPDVEYTVGDSVSITPGGNFTNEDSITVSGLPAGTGLSFDGTSITGALNAADRLASPFLVTVTATNGNGSINDSFLFTVNGAILVSGSVVTPAVRMLTVGTRRSLSPKVWTQDVTDRLDYGFDLVTWLGSDTINNVVVTEGESIVGTGIYENTKLMVFVAGGTLEQATKVTCHVTTAYGREIDVSFYVAFVDM